MMALTNRKNWYLRFCDASRKNFPLSRVKEQGNRIKITNTGTTLVVPLPCFVCLGERGQYPYTENNHTAVLVLSKSRWCGVVAAAEAMG